MENFPTYAITLLLFLLHGAHQTQGQAPAAAPAPAPAPTNITAILEKAGQFGTLIRLLKSTQVADRINSQLNDSNSGLTVLAPTDSAFSSLSSGTVNSLTNQQQVALLQSHVIPSFIPAAEFETVSNPISTQAGDAYNGQYSLNVTTSGNQVNISTGLVNATATSLYSDGQLAVYQVDEVLLPLGIFRPSRPAPAPSPSEGEKNGSSPSDGPNSKPLGDSTEASDAIGQRWREAGGGLAFAAVVSFLF